MRSTYPLGPWPLGIDNISIVTRLKADDKGRVIALRDAVNVDVDRDGKPTRRRGRALVTAQPDLNSLWRCPLGAFASAGTALFAVSPSGGLTQIATLNSAEPCSYAQLNDGVVAANRTTLLLIRGATVQPLGISDASTPTAQPSPTGGLAAGRYSIAVSFLRARVEGGLSALSSVTVPQGGGIALTNLPIADDADTIRVYATEPGGETLYRVGDTAPGRPAFLIGAGLRGKTAPTQWLRRMPSGSLVASWRGRLLLVRNNVLYVSRPMAYHLYSPRHGYVQFESRIRMLAAVDAGVFVGTDDGVVFLRGGRPREWVQETTGALPPFPGQSADISAFMLGQGTQQGDNVSACWLAQNGFVLGTNDGRVIEPQGDRVWLGDSARAQLAVHNRRVTAAVT